MAIDPSIVLGIKPPPVIDPVDQYAKIQGVRNMISQQQLRQQQAQMDQAKFEHEQQQNAEADRASAAQKKLGELIAANSTQDAQGNTQTNHQAVIQGLAAAGHGKEAVAYDTQRRADEGAAINNQKTQIDNSKKQLDAMGNALQSLSQVPDENLAAAYDQNLQQLTQQGLVKPGTVPPSQAILQQGGIPALRQFIQQHGQAAMTADQQITAHQKDLDYALRLNEFHQTVLKEAPDTNKKWTDLVAQTVSAATSQPQLDAALKNAVEAGAPLSVVRQFPSQFSPDAVKQAEQIGQTAAQKQESIDKNRPIAGRDVPLPADVAAQHVQIALAGRPPSEAAQNTLDREAKQFGGAHAKSLEAANSQLEKISDARAMINGPAEAQALGIPKVLTALVGGQGSGVRITQPELNAILKARGVVGDFEGFISSVSGKGKLTSEQQRQLTGILDDVKARIEQKRSIANDALDRINTAKGRDEIVSIDKEARGKIADLEKSTNASNGAKVRVKRKSDGQTGTIDAKDFDQAKYEKIQ